MDTKRPRVSTWILYERHLLPPLPLFECPDDRAFSARLIVMMTDDGASISDGKLRHPLFCCVVRPPSCSCNGIGFGQICRHSGLESVEFVVAAVVVMYLFPAA